MTEVGGATAPAYTYAPAQNTDVHASTTGPTGVDAASSTVPGASAPTTYSPDPDPVWTLPFPDPELPPTPAQPPADDVVLPVDPPTAELPPAPTPTEPDPQPGPAPEPAPQPTPSFPHGPQPVLDLQPVLQPVAEELRGVLTATVPTAVEVPVAPGPGWIERREAVVIAQIQVYGETPERLNELLNLDQMRRTLAKGARKSEDVLQLIQSLNLGTAPRVLIQRMLAGGGGLEMSATIQDLVGSGGGANGAEANGLSSLADFGITAPAGTRR